MLQKIIIIGNLGGEPESRFTPSGQQVTSFSVATSNQYKNAGGETVKETTWFKVQTWGRLAEICKQYLNKGSKVYVEGRLAPDKTTGGPRIWTKQDGSSAASFDLNASEVKFLSPKSESQPTHATSSELPPEDDIPF